MKTWLCANIIALSMVTCAYAQGTAITITPYIGPHDVSQAFVNNVVSGTTGTSSPSMPRTIVGDIARISSIIFTPNFNSWTGSVAAATGAFSGQHGNTVYFSYDIRSDVPFNPWTDVSYMISGPGFSFSNSFGGGGIAYDMQGIGYAPGGGTYTSGPMNSLVTRIQGTGLNYTIQVSGTGLQSAIDQTIKNRLPFDLTATYWLNDCTASSTIHFVVPEPSGGLISLLAAGLIWHRRRRT